MKTVLAQLKQYKKDTFLTMGFTTLEVIMEVLSSVYHCADHRRRAGTVRYACHHQARHTDARYGGGQPVLRRDGGKIRGSRIPRDSPVI